MLKSNSVEFFVSLTAKQSDGCTGWTMLIVRQIKCRLSDAFSFGHCFWYWEQGWFFQRPIFIILHLMNQTLLFTSYWDRESLYSCMNFLESVYKIVLNKHKLLWLRVQQIKTLMQKWHGRKESFKKKWSTIKKWAGNLLLRPRNILFLLLRGCGSPIGS